MDAMTTGFLTVWPQKEGSSGPAGDMFTRFLSQSIQVLSQGSGTQGCGWMDVGRSWACPFVVGTWAPQRTPTPGPNPALPRLCHVTLGRSLNLPQAHFPRCDKGLHKSPTCSDFCEHGGRCPMQSSSVCPDSQRLMDTDLRHCSREGMFCERELSLPKSAWRDDQDAHRCPEDE